MFWKEESISSAVTTTVQSNKVTSGDYHLRLGRGEIIQFAAEQMTTSKVQ